MSTDVLSLLSSVSFEAVIAAMIAISVGVIANILSSKMAKMAKLENERLKSLQDALVATVNTKATETAGAIAERLPVGASPEMLERSIGRAVRDGIAHLEATKSDKLDFVAELITSYHKQALSQAKVQFWFSVIAASVGFVYILGMALHATESSSGSVLSIVPGVVIDAVAFLFFRQAEQTRERATSLYDRLRQDRQNESARDLVESVDDPRIRALVKAQIALHMAGISSKELDLQGSSGVS